MKKRILSMALCLCVALGALPALSARADAAGTRTMAQLRESFPAGKYWNHYVGKYGEDGDMMGTSEFFADSVTGSPCSIHGVTAGRVGIYDCNCFDGAWQCMGFARRLAYGYYGTRVSTWAVDDNLGALKAGDVVQYSFADGSYGHTVWITAVDGDNITYADCNGESLASTANNCKIRWDVRGVKGLFYSGTGNYRVYHAPYAAADAGPDPAGPRPAAWPTADIGDFYATIYYPAGGSLVEAQGGDGSTYTNVQLSGEGVPIDSTDPKRIWFFDKQDDGSYRVVNEWCGWCLDVSGGRAGDGINVGTWHEDHGGLPERWYIMEVPDSDNKWHSLVTALEYPAYVMCVSDGAAAAGTNVQLSATDWKTGKEAQQFNIVRQKDYQPAKPPSPADVWVNRDNGKITVTWDAVPAQGSYDIREYEVRFRNAATGVCIDCPRQIGVSYTYGSSLPAGEWSAEVRAINTKYAGSSCCYSSEYCARRFTVDAAPGAGADRAPTAGFGPEYGTPDTSYTPWGSPYADVSSRAWYYDAVRFASENGLMSGDKGLFRPEDRLTRAMLARILYNKAGQPYMAGGWTFADVPPGVWYSDAVAWAASTGVAGGYGNGLFGPDDGVTREQLAVMLWRYAGSPASSGQVAAGDAGQISGYAQSAMRWAVGNGVITGYGDGRLDPKGPATRAQVARVLQNLWAS